MRVSFPLLIGLLSIDSSCCHRSYLVRLLFLILILPLVRIHITIVAVVKCRLLLSGLVAGDGDDGGDAVLRWLRQTQLLLLLYLVVKRVRRLRPQFLLVCKAASRRIAVSIVAGEYLLHLADRVINQVEADWTDGICVAEGIGDSIGRGRSTALRVTRVVLAPEGSLLRIGYCRLVQNSLGNSFILFLALFEHRLQLLNLLIFLSQYCDEMLRIKLNSAIRSKYFKWQAILVTCLVFKVLVQ